MADKPYPKIPEAVWWNLRTKFASSLPPTVTPSWLATLLGYKEESAKKGLMPQLRMVGLIDDDGKPTDRANNWRTDGTYESVCQAIREEFYPPELLDLFPTANASDRVRIVDWFKRTARLGDSAAGQSTAFYMLLTDAKVRAVEDKPPKAKSGESSAKNQQKPNQTTRKVTPQASIAAAKMQTAAVSVTETPVHPTKHPVGPSIHIDLQIHISPEASLDQINAIFKGIAEHLYVK